MLKDLSRRLGAIRDNPEDACLVNTEMAFGLLGVLEDLAHLTDRHDSSPATPSPQS